MITGVGSDEPGVSVKHEIELVKASLLYADTVEVLSLGNQLVRDIHKFTTGDTSNLWALLLSLDDDTLRHLGVDVDLEHFREVLSMVLTMDSTALRAVAGSHPDMAQLEEFADILDQTHEQASSTMSELRQVIDRLRLELGVAELEMVLDNRLVRFNENVAISEDTDVVIQSFMHEFRRYLQDPTKFVLLDATMASIARSMINEGFVRQPERAVSNASEAVLGTGFLARLPPSRRRHWMRSWICAGT